VLPVIRGATKFQPVYAADVGKAIHGRGARSAPPRQARSYELGGPQVLTMRELMEWTCQTTNRNRTLVDIPDPAARMMARAFGWLPAAPITWDQWLMLQRDNVVSEGAKACAASASLRRHSPPCRKAGSPPIAATAASPPSSLIDLRKGCTT
jgi:NADH dehydrogenase